MENYIVKLVKHINPSLNLIRDKNVNVDKIILVNAKNVKVKERRSNELHKKLIIKNNF